MSKVYGIVDIERKLFQTTSWKEQESIITRLKKDDKKSASTKLIKLKKIETLYSTQNLRFLIYKPIKREKKAEEENLGDLNLQIQSQKLKEEAIRDNEYETKSQLQEMNRAKDKVSTKSNSNKMQANWKNKIK